MRPAKRRVLLLRAAFYSCLFLGSSWMAWAGGAGMDGEFDSAFYVDGARHLAAGEGYVSALTEPAQTDDGPITRWAPGFPLLIAVAIALGFDALHAASLVLGLCYALSVTWVGAIGVRVMGFRNWPGCLLAAFSFAVLPGTLRSLSALLSDLPFACFALLALLLCLDLARARRPRVLHGIALGACLAFSFLLRYAGALFIPGLLLATFYAMRVRRRSFWLACRALLPTVAIIAAVVVLWIARNRQFGPEAFGQRVFVDGSLAEQFERGIGGAFSCFLQLPALSKLALACALVLVPLGWRRTRRSLLLLALPALAYFAAMVGVASRVHFDPIDATRFWVVVPPLCFLGLLTLALRTRRRWLLTPLRVIACSLVATIAVVSAVSARDSLAGARQPRGLLAPRWQLASAVLPAADSCRLFVMDPRPFMLHRALGPTSAIPLSADEYERAAPQHPALCLAVVSKRLRLSSSAERRRPLQAAVVEQLQQAGRLERVADAAGVTVYRVRDAAHR